MTFRAEFDGYFRERGFNRCPDSRGLFSHVVEYVVLLECCDVEHGWDMSKLSEVGGVVPGST